MSKRGAGERDFTPAQGNMRKARVEVRRADAFQVLMAAARARNSAAQQQATAVAAATAAVLDYEEREDRVFCLGCLEDQQVLGDGIGFGVPNAHERGLITEGTCHHNFGEIACNWKGLSLETLAQRGGASLRSCFFGLCRRNAAIQGPAANVSKQ
ncbi:hypothetical protein VOLCADRAFT_88836 [Volvox carteri f. nagariensis]|uniref:Uncharacterized protein n=1 Tax=Volvox carteri f. nagariensis TaxID=3068 RepID=D8TQ32_VOLCA|nr:uncharacterized protein VOLCADRAFT_88836 [Volvox carteri f. nagariensis]EFJ50335.1 hypothetical protein VOLCADRAFT_88836 [Volvox carteri f. nagariensis]|eukprot:XP_002948460.1 hypothetical protein VOLCADRAFT_88836 [Volvox carteri f. nagariensis]